MLDVKCFFLKLLETKAIEQQIKEIVGQFEVAMRDGLTEEEITAIQDRIDTTSDKLAEMNEYIQQFDFGVEGTPDVTMDRTFRAGSTSSITYHNTFAVQSQIFLDDTEAARQAANKLAPYIQKYIERNS